MTELQYLQTVTSAQAFMATLNPQLRVDGKWGRYTQSVYAGLSFADRQRVDKLVSALSGQGVDSLAGFRTAEKQSAVTANRPEIIKAIYAAADEFQIDRNTLVAFAQIESNLNPKASNQSSKGLMQMQPGAWLDAQKLAKLRPYADGVWDYVECARAGAAYINFNKRTLDRIGYKGPWDAAHMYLAHQQGAGGLNAMYVAAQGGKSSLSAANMRGNPPQDRLGVTTDPVQFYKRWINVVNKRLA